MAGAILVGNMALMADVGSSRPHASDRAKLWPLDTSTVVRTKREVQPQFVFSADGSNSDVSKKSSPWNPLLGLGSKSWWKRRGESKIGASASSSEETADVSEVDEEEEEEDDYYEEWEKWQEEAKKRVKEREEMQELEKAANELQRRLDEEGNSDETEEEKRERVRRELAKVAKEQAERRKTADMMFDLGKKAYSKGMYSRAVEFLEASLTIISGSSLLGGEIQIWLAMSYEAARRHKDCIDLYKELESQHPAITIRRQAAELRYILQAPKLKISKDEMVTIPLIGSSYDWYAGTWTDKTKEQEMRKKVGVSEPQSSQDYFGDFFLWSPPSGWEKNRNLWGIVTLWFFLIGTALYLQR